MVPNFLKSAPRAPAKPPSVPLRTARGALTRLARLPLVTAMSNGVKRLAEAGTHRYQPDVRRRLKILNFIAYLIATTTLIYAVQQASMDAVKYAPVILVNLALVVTMLLVPFAHRISDIAGGLLIVAAEYGALLFFASFFGTGAGGQLQYIIAAAATFVVLGSNRIRLILFLVALGLALHLYVWFTFPPKIGLTEADQAIVDSQYIQGAATTFVLIAASVHYAFRLAERAKAEVDSLLRNILPDSVVERLQEKPGTAIADSFASASVLFADISGFVPLARALGPERTVELLNRVVSAFDDLAQRHGVEKIKTIGDAYMVAAGIPDHAPDHAVRLARLGLDMLAVVETVRKERDLELHIRVGIASGPVMAGVIGTKKFSYDVWGDAVNLAARLEGTGRLGRVHICPACRALLPPEFETESCGMIEIKGVGLQETWLLRDPHADVSAGGHAGGGHAPDGLGTASPFAKP